MVYTEEVYKSIPFFRELLNQGSARISEIKKERSLDTEVKGQFASGDPDIVTRADRELRDVYHEAMQRHFPNWAVILEDGVERLSPSDLKKDVVAFFDSVDASKLLEEGLPGSSTMAAVAVRGEEGYRPILGLIKIVDGPYMYGYADGTNVETNVKAQIVSREKIIIGRPKADRSGLLGKACQALQGDVEHIRGIGPQTQALMEGRTDIFIYDLPGPSVWDVFPALPIIKANGGYVCNWSGREPAFDGQNKDYGGMIAAMPQVDRNHVVSRMRTSLLEF